MTTNATRKGVVLWSLLVPLVMTLFGGMAFGQTSGGYAPSPGDASRLDQLIFILELFAAFGLGAAILWWISNYARGNALQTYQLNSWMVRVGNVLRNSIGAHSWVISHDHLKDAATKHRRSLGEVHTTQNRPKIEAVLAETERRVRVLEEDERGAWFLLVDMPASKTVIPFFLSLTLQGHLRNWWKQAKSGEGSDKIVFADSKAQALGLAAARRTVDICTANDFTIERICGDKGGVFPASIQVISSQKGFPDCWIDFKYNAGLALVASLRSPKEPGKPIFDSLADRELAQADRARTLASYFLKEDFSQIGFDMPWARVCSSLGHWLASFRQMRKLSERYPGIGIEEMKFSVIEQNFWAKKYAQELFKLAQSGNVGDLYELISLIGPDISVYDSTLWYRGDGNWKQIAQPVMQDESPLIASDDAIQFIGGPRAILPTRQVMEEADRHAAYGPGILLTKAMSIRDLYDPSNMSPQVLEALHAEGLDPHGRKVQKRKQQGGPTMFSRLHS